MGKEPRSAWQIVTGPDQVAAPSDTPDNPETRIGRALPLATARGPETRRGLPRVVQGPRQEGATGEPEEHGPEGRLEAPRTRPAHLRAVPSPMPPYVPPPALPVRDQTLAFYAPEAGEAGGAGGADRADRIRARIGPPPPIERAPGARAARRREPTGGGIALRLVHDTVRDADPGRVAGVAPAGRGALDRVDLDLARARRDGDPKRQSTLLELREGDARPWKTWAVVGLVLSLGGVLAWWLA